MDHEIYLALLELNEKVQFMYDELVKQEILSEVKDDGTDKQTRTK